MGQFNWSKIKHFIAQYIWHQYKCIDRESYSISIDQKQKTDKMSSYEISGKTQILKHIDDVRFWTNNLNYSKLRMVQASGEKARQMFPLDGLNSASDDMSLVWYSVLFSQMLLSRQMFRR